MGLHFYSPLETVGRCKARTVVLAVGTHRDGLATGSDGAENLRLHAQPVAIDGVVDVVPLISVVGHAAGCRDLHLSEELEHLRI